MSSEDRAVFFMRLAHLRAAVLSVLAGGSLTVGVLAGLPGTARASGARLSAASPSPSTSTAASPSPSASQ